jgi:D-glycero-alpha-D-manno-heptose 1-phosphate guanylyltransferase
MEAIILVGGLGSRLGELTRNTPKPLLPIRSVPFLYYLLHTLKKKKVAKTILACGYMADHFENLIAPNSDLEFPEIVISREVEPLGTGGAIMQALNLTNCDNVLILNGDSYIDVDLNSLRSNHLESNSDITLTTTFQYQSERFGLINASTDNRIVSFQNPNGKSDGYINAGVYLAKVKFLKKIFDKIENTSFSFEEDILSKVYTSSNLYHFPVNSKFTDIGIPSDYLNAQKTLFR